MMFDRFKTFSTALCFYVLLNIKDTGIHRHLVFNKQMTQMQNKSIYFFLIHSIKNVAYYISHDLRF